MAIKTWLFPLCRFLSTDHWMNATYIERESEMNKRFLTYVLLFIHSKVTHSHTYYWKTTTTNCNRNERKAVLAVYLSYAIAHGYYRGNVKYSKPGSLTALFRILQSNSYSPSYMSHILQLLYTQFSNNPFPYPSSNHHFKVSFLYSGYYHHAINQKILLPRRQPFFFSDSYYFLKQLLYQTK